MLDFAIYLRGELSPKTPIPLGQAIINKYDMELFGSWSKTIAQTMAKAMYIHTICFGLKYKNVQVHKSVLDLDIKSFKETFETLKTFVETGVMEIKKNSTKRLIKII